MKPLSSLDDFTEHLVKSSTATKLGITNEIPANLSDNVEKLYDCYLFIFNVLSPDGIYITSGYRCAELNKAVGGVPGSKHCQCKAFDFAFPNVVTKSDFLLVFNQMRYNYKQYLAAAGFDTSACDEKFRKLFIPYPERFFVHFQRP